MIKDVFRCLVHIAKAQFLIGRDVQNDTPRTLEGLVDERALHRLLDGIHGAAPTLPDAQQGIAALALAENRRDIRKVHIDHARRQNQLRHAANSLFEHLIRRRKGIDKGHGLILGQLHEIVVLHGNQSIHMGLHLDDPRLGGLLLSRALKGEGHRDHADDQNAELLRYARHNGRRPRPRAAAHACRHEDEIRSLHHGLELLLVTLGRPLAIRHIAARTASRRSAAP